MNDNVNHPAHYTDGKIEVIDFIEDKAFSYHLGNAIKYISRAGKKDPDKTIEDLRKAIWYIERQIQVIEKLDPPMDFVEARRYALEMRDGWVLDPEKADDFWETVVAALG